jgi:hypothetical protein
VVLASRNSPASAAGGDHTSRYRRRLSKGQQGATQLRSQSIACDSEASRDRQPGSRLKLGPSQSEKGRDRYARIFPLLVLVTQKDWNAWTRSRVSYGIPFSSCFWCPNSSLARATSFFHLHLICLHPFMPVPSLQLLLALSFQKFSTFACCSELLFLTTSLMGVNAAALSTERPCSVPPLSREILSHIASDWSAFADVLAVARAL